MGLVVPRDYKPGLLDAAWVKTTGRSWWQAVYTDGHVVSEWDTLGDLTNPQSGRWEERRTKGLRTLILICPNGKAYRLTSGEDDKLFQLKQEQFTVGRGRRILAHIIGVVINTDGDCVCFAWEPRQRQFVADPAKQDDCALHAASPYDLAGHYRKEFRGHAMLPDGSCYCCRWEVTPDRIVQFKDNVLAMSYGNIGPLGLDNLRLRF